MRKYLILLLILMIALAGCTPIEVPTQGTQGTQETQGTQGTTPEPTPTPTPEAGPIDPYAENGGKNLNLLCGIDKHGRVFMPVAGTNEKQVGIYYFVWHGMDVKMTGTYNITELLKSDPEALWNDTLGDGSVSPVNRFHYWDEPLFGYYRSTDEWVAAKHMEMLTHAGIDFIYIDVTNADPYFKSCNVLFKVMKDMKEKGWDVPGVVFYTNSYSILTIERIYDYYYKKRNTFDSLWYRPDGEHPMIIGNYTPETDRYEARKRGDTKYDPKPLSDEITSYFDLRAAQWPDDDFNYNGIPWNEWTFPQPIHNGVMNVSLAQHPNLPFSNSVTLGRDYNWGRGYDFTTKENVEANAEIGTNFQAQWDNVLKKANKIDMVTVTGWNEWTAIKLVDPNYGPKVYFVDTTNAEFSRDIEPQRNGGFEDSYYLQLIDNVRRFKGISGELARPERMSKRLGADEWERVSSIYYTGCETGYERNSTSAGDIYTYKQDAPRNNLQYVKVADNDESLQFMVSCQNELVATDSSSFLNVYIGVDSLERKGWEGYELVAVPASGKLYSLDEGGARTEVGDIDVEIKGSRAVITVKLDLIGATDGVYFKVTDNFESTNIMDSYTTGKCIPMGRLSWYYYLSK